MIDTVLDEPPACFISESCGIVLGGEVPGVREVRYVKTKNCRANQAPHALPCFIRKQLADNC